MHHRQVLQLTDHPAPASILFSATQTLMLPWISHPKGMIVRERLVWVCRETGRRDDANIRQFLGEGSVAPSYNCG